MPPEQLRGDLLRDVGCVELSRILLTLAHQRLAVLVNQGRRPLRAHRPAGGSFLRALAENGTNVRTEGARP
jgi:hypothetical protein